MHFMSESDQWQRELELFGPTRNEKFGYKPCRIALITQYVHDVNVQTSDYYIDS